MVQLLREVSSMWRIEAVKLSNPAHASFSYSSLFILCFGRIMSKNKMPNPTGASFSYSSSLLFHTLFCPVSNRSQFCVMCFFFFTFCHYSLVVYALLLLCCWSIHFVTASFCPRSYFISADSLFGQPRVVVSWQPTMEVFFAKT